MRRLALVWIGFAFLGCPPPPPAPPEPPGEPDDVPAKEVCAHLAALECREGTVSNCVRAIEKARAFNLADFNSRCLIARQNKEGIRACGPSVECK